MSKAKFNTTSSGSFRYLLVIGLVSGWFSPGAVDIVQLAERRLGPDTEATDVSTRRHLQQVQARDGQQVDAGNVPERSGNPVVLVVNNQRARTLLEAAVTHFTFTSSQATRPFHLQKHFHIWF